MSSFYEAYYHIGLKDYYNVENDVLGKVIKVPVGRHGIYEICFPKISLDDKTLLVPYYEDEYKNNNRGNIIEIGRSSECSNSDGKFVGYMYSIKSVIVHYISSKEISKYEFIDKNGFVNVRDQAVEFCKLINVLKPNCVTREHGESYENSLVKDVVYSRKKDGEWIGGCYSMIILSGTEKLSLSFIHKELSNFTNQLSLQYSLAYDAHTKFKNNDPRGCILDCVTIIESYIRRSIRNIYKAKGLKDKDIDPILLSLNGIAGANQLLRKLGRPVKLKKFESIIQLRNRIIHGGMNASQSDASMALTLLDIFLEEYQINKFEGSI